MAVGAPMEERSPRCRRACVAASNLPDYEDSDNDPATGCTNPSFAYCLTATTAGPCLPGRSRLQACDNPLRPTPCTVTVTLTHDFHLMAPLGFDFFGVHLGLPTTLTFDRDSTFAMTDIDVAAPTP